MGFLSNKRALITGVLSQRSLAAGIASAMHREGAELAFTYQGEKVKDRVSDIAATFDSNLVFPCDVSDDQQINDLMSSVSQHWQDGFDIVVHAIAFAPREELEGDYSDVTTREGFKIAHDISSYSLTALAAAARPHLQKRGGGAVVTLSYFGAERVIPNYNVMGVAKASLEANVRYLAASLGPDNIRVNAVSAGPVKTLAASGIGGLKKMLQYNESVAPLRRNITADDVGNASAFLCSDLASAITGEVLYVDAGFNIMGMGPAV